MSKIEIFVGDLVNHGSDKMVLAKVVEQLEHLDRPAIVIANLEIGRQLDLVVALDDLTLVIEAKAFRTAIHGSENGLHWEAQTGSGRWKPTGNALQQTRAAKLALRDRMRTFHQEQNGYPEAALIFCPTIPQGSSIPAGDFKAAVCELKDVGLLLTRTSGLQWPLPRWRAFAESLGLTRVGTVEAACHPDMARAEALLASYTAAFRTTYAPLADELIPGSTRDGQGEIVDGLLRRSQEGENILLRGPSGCGKSLWSCRIGLGAADGGAIPLFIYAKDYDGRLGQVLDREAALLGVPSYRALAEACRHLSRPLRFLVDGYNECAAAHRAKLTRGMAALCERNTASLVITSQIALERADLLTLTDVVISAPDKETKLAIAARRAPNSLSAAARAWIDTVQSGLEARILGEVSHRIAETGNRMALFDTYVRTRLGVDAPAGFSALIAVARLLSDRISFVLSVRDLYRLIDREGLPPEIVPQLERANLLALRGDRAGFGHEMFHDAFAAEALIRAADGRPEAILAAMKSPLHARRAVQLIGSIDDTGLLATVLAGIEDSRVAGACLAGECGTFAQAWARKRIDDVLDRALLEAETASFVIDESCYPQLRRTDPCHSQWTPGDHAIIGALPDEFLAGRQVERMMGILAALDRTLASEAQRLRGELAGRRIALRSALFELCYVHGQGRAPAIGSLLLSLHLGVWPEERESRAADILRAWIERPDLTHGQIYLLLMLGRIAWDEGPILAPFLPDILRRVYRYAPYHLQLDLLQAAHFSWRADDTEKAAIIDALNDLPGDQHIFLSSSLIEALQALGALDESEAEQVEPLRQTTRDALESGDAEAAYANWNCRFDHPYAGAYCEVIEELAPEERKALLELSARAAPLDGLFCSILLVELAEFGDPSAAPLIARWLAFPPSRCPMPQDAVKCFMTAHISLARLACDLPGDRPAPRSPAQAALGACGDILYWLNRIDLHPEHRQRNCFAPLAVLARHEAGVASAALYELGRCYLGEGLDRLPGAGAPVRSIEADFPDEVAQIFRHCLKSPERQAGYFAHGDLEAIMSCAISGLARTGDAGDLPILRALAASPTLGQTALRAISQLEQRLLESVPPT